MLKDKKDAPLPSGVIIDKKKGKDTKAEDSDDDMQPTFEPMPEVRAAPAFSRLIPGNPGLGGGGSELASSLPFPFGVIPETTNFRSFFPRGAFLATKEIFANCHSGGDHSHAVRCSPPPPA